jgi:hypothetical protein
MDSVKIMFKLQFPIDIEAFITKMSSVNDRTEQDTVFEHTRASQATLKWLPLTVTVLVEYAAAGSTGIREATGSGNTVRYVLIFISHCNISIEQLDA